MLILCIGNLGEKGRSQLCDCERAHYTYCIYIDLHLSYPYTYLSYLLPCTICTYTYYLEFVALLEYGYVRQSSLFRTKKKFQNDH